MIIYCSSAFDADLWAWERAMVRAENARTHQLFVRSLTLCRLVRCQPGYHQPDVDRRPLQSPSSFG
jgi:hypothetical protein